MNVIVKNTMIVLLLICQVKAFTQETVTTDSVPAKPTSKFNSFNKKAEAFFKKYPVPIFSYSTEAGTTLGLAKFNVFNLSKTDTISKPSKLSEVATVSTKGRINVSVSTELVFNENKFVNLSYINFKQQPEFIFGIGNDVKREDMEEVQYSRIKFNSANLFLAAKNLYIGVPLDVSYYFDMKVDSSSFLIKDNIPGTDGGFTLGLGLAAAYDTRDNRYNSYKGAYILSTILWHPTFLGSAYQFYKFEFDARKFFNPWLNHVIAIQAATSYENGDVPFYELALMGGDSRMRGYYLGAYRDNVLVDGQIEYRAPIWSVFGLTSWVGMGRVASSYNDLSLDGFKVSYGFGLRVKMDSKHNTNLRLDFGFGQDGVNGTYISFAEAF